MFTLSRPVVNSSRLDPAARRVPTEWQWPGDPSATRALRHRDARALPSEGGQERRRLQWGVVKANGVAVRQPAAVRARCGGVQRTAAAIEGPVSVTVPVEIALPATTSSPTSAPSAAKTPLHWGCAALPLVGHSWWTLHWDGHLCGQRSLCSHAEELPHKHGEQGGQFPAGHDQWRPTAIPSPHSGSSHQFRAKAPRDLEVLGSTGPGSLQGCGELPEQLL